LQSCPRPALYGSLSFPHFPAQPPLCGIFGADYEMELKVNYNLKPVLDLGQILKGKIKSNTLNSLFIKQAL
jgi:hypothetical protein